MKAVRGQHLIVGLGKLGDPLQLVGQ